MAKRDHSTRGSNAKRDRVDLMKIDARLSKRLESASNIELEVLERLAGVGISLEFLPAWQRKKRNNCRTTNDNDGLFPHTRRQMNAANRTRRCRFTFRTDQPQSSLEQHASAEFDLPCRSRRVDYAECG